MTPEQQALMVTLRPYITAYHSWVSWYTSYKALATVVPLPQKTKDATCEEFMDHIEDAWWWVLATAMWTAQAQDEGEEWIKEVFQACEIMPLTI